MSGDVVTLREYVERVLEERQRAHRDALSATEKDLDARANALEIRLESMNEFRKQMSEERLIYVRREQYEGLDERVFKMEKALSNAEGRFWAVGVGLTVGLTVLTSVLTVAARYLLK